MRRFLRALALVLAAALCCGCALGEGIVPMGGVKKVAIVEGKALKLEVNQQLQLTAKLSPEGATGAVKWSSSNKSVAKVDASTGLVTARKAGTAKITAKVGKKKATIKITVLKPVMELSVYFGKSLSSSAKKVGGLKKHKLSGGYVSYSNKYVTLKGYQGKGKGARVNDISIEKSNRFLLFDVFVGMEAETAKNLLARFVNSEYYEDAGGLNYALYWEDDFGYLTVELSEGRVKSISFSNITNG